METTVTTPSSSPSLITLMPVDQSKSHVLVENHQEFEVFNCIQKKFKFSIFLFSKF
jgi:hypothetical protein